MVAWSEIRLLERVARTCDDFSAQVYNAVDEDWEFFSRKGELTLDEEFHTKTLLRSLRGTPGIVQWTFSRHGESRSGADWEWWIGSDDLGWRCARIQAKIAHPRTPSGIADYPTLGHKVGKTGSQRLQIDLLIEGAHSLGETHVAREARTRGANTSRLFVDPYYCFYSGPILNSAADNDILPAVVASQVHAVDAAAGNRADVPEWAEWIRGWTYHCSGPSNDWPWALCAHCVADGPTPFRRHVRYWGAAVVPAEVVWDRFVGGRSLSAEAHLKGALPLSTVLFTQYARLNAANGGGGLPDYAEMMLRSVRNRRLRASRPDEDAWFADVAGIAGEVGVQSVGIVDVSG